LQHKSKLNLVVYALEFAAGYTEKCYKTVHEESLILVLQQVLNKFSFNVIDKLKLTKNKEFESQSKKITQIISNVSCASSNFNHPYK
jgi:hypothetical protein